MNSCDIVQRYFSYWPWSSLLLLCWPIVARNTSTRLWSLSRGDNKKTRGERTMCQFIFFTQQSYLPNIKLMIYQKLRNFYGLKMVTHQNLAQSSHSSCASCLPCFKQRSARDPGLGSTIQSPKGPEGEKRHGMKLMKVMKLKVVRIFRDLSFWKLPSTLMVNWNEGKK